MNNFSLGSVLEEIKKNLGSKRVQEIEEQETTTNNQPADTVASASDRAAFRARTGSTVNSSTNQVQSSQPTDTVASTADRDAFRARTGSTVDSRSGQVQSSQPSDTVASAADRSAFRARTGSTVGATNQGTTTAATRPAGAPTTAARPAGAPVRPTQRPTQTATPTQSGSAQAFQSYSNKGDDASSADFFRADRQAQAERRGASAAPVSRPAGAPVARPTMGARPAMGARPMARISGGTSGSAGNARMSLEENFDQFVKTFIKESNGKQYREKQKLTINIGSAKHDPTSPNVSHIEEAEKNPQKTMDKHFAKQPQKRQDAINLHMRKGKSYWDAVQAAKKHVKEEIEQIDETLGTATGLGGRHNPRKSFPKNSLAGGRYKRRASLQRSGNQKRSPGIYEESHAKAMKKITEKKNEKVAGRTDTGKPSDPVNTEPNKPEMTGYHR